MPVPTSLNDLSTTPASNYPAGSESPSVLDDTLRAHAALIATLRDLNNTGPLGGLRNLIINGNFAISQRGYVSGTATSGANQYTLDRWRVVTSGQNATFTASGNGNLVTAPAGGLEQVIEGLSIAGGTYVINWTGTATCTVAGVARAKGATFSLTASTNVAVRFSGGTVGDVQVEPGTVVTVFEARPVGLELMLCQRYWESIPFRVDFSGNATSDFGTIMVFYKATKRALPTLSRADEVLTSASFNSYTGSSLAGVGVTYNPTSSTTGFVTGSLVADAEL